MFAIPSLFAALRPRPGPRDAFERGVVALERGDRRAALAEFEFARAEAADDARRCAVENKRGVVLVGLGEHERALAAFAAALAYDERHAPTLTNLGNLLFEGGDVADAIDYYEAAMRADPTYPLAHRNLGVALKRLGRRSESVRALRTASRLESRPRSGRA